MALSYSQLQTYRRCPKQYEFLMVKKVPRSISAGESFGSSIHNTLKRFGALEMAAVAPEKSVAQLHLFTEAEEHRKHPTMPDLHTLLSLWRTCFIAEGYASTADRDRALVRGEKVLRQFFTWWSACQRSVVGIEQMFRLQIPSKDEEKETILSGRFDRVERTDKGLCIIDFKTSLPRPQEEIDEDLQLSIYALAAEKQWNEPVHELLLLFLQENVVVARSTTRHRKQLDDALGTIQGLEQGIEQKYFDARPERGTCMHCPYRSMCPASLAI